MIEAVLPRRTSFTRKEAFERTVEQVVAANVDTGVRRHRVRRSTSTQAARALPDLRLGQRLDPGDRRQQVATSRPTPKRGAR